MDIMNSYLQSTHTALQQTYAVAVADMAMNGTAANMASLVEDLAAAVPAQQSPPAGLNGVGLHIDTYA